MTSRRRVLIVGSDRTALPYLRALDRVDAEAVDTVDEARRVLAARPPDVVLASLDLRDGNGVELLRASASAAPDARRILVAAYDELASAVRAGASHAFVDRVLPRGRWSAQTHALVTELVLGEQPTPARAADDPSLDENDARELALETIRAIARVPGLVVRPLSVDRRVHQVQLVAPRGAAFDRVRCELPRTWGWPIENLGQMRPWHQAHPVVREIGSLFVGQEVYAQSVRGPTPVSIYLAVLPWGEEERATFLFGVFAPAGFTRAHRALVLEAHRVAIDTVPELVLPTTDPEWAVAPTRTSPELAAPSAAAAYVVHYDWIATDTYVGPDRRARPTGLLGARSLAGRRRIVPAGLGRFGASFVDALPRATRIAVIACVALAALDTALTASFVRTRAITEANPFARWLLFPHPWAFVAIRGGVSLTSIAIVARFHLFAIARYLLPLLVCAHASLCIYWVWLLAAR